MEDQGTIEQEGKMSLRHHEGDSGDDFGVESRVNLDDIIHSMKSGLYVADNNGNISFANQAFAEIFQYRTRDDIVGLNLAENLYERRKDRITFLRQLMENGFVSDYIIPMVRRDGSRVVISARSNFLKDKTGRVVGVQGIVKELPEEQEVRGNKGQEIHDLAYQDEEACRTLDKLIRDPLTGLYNYQYFMKCLEAETLRADRFFQPLSLIMIDIDNFEVFNNQFGREEGDALIKEVGVLFRKNFRDTDIVCRQSQDQFLVILPETKKEEALSVAKAVKDVIQESSFQTSVTCSMGLSRYISGMTTQELLLKANLGLYMAKEMGRNEACLYG